MKILFKIMSMFLLTFLLAGCFSDNNDTNVILSNTSPIADAGTDQGINTGNTVTLDGSGSSDADGDPLTYSWSMTAKPSGSSAALSGPDTASPTFTADMDGEYVVQLIVNDGTVNSAADSVTITAATASVNTAPVADAGADQNINTGSTVTLDGSGSTDTDGDSLTYSWSFISVPSGSGAALSGADTVSPTFTADMDGEYVVQLIVNDGTVNSAADSVTITAATASVNTQPVADAGTNQVDIPIGSTVKLDGSGSYDADGDSLTYSWGFTSVPIGSSISNASLSSTTVVSPTFIPDVAGNYVLQLTVHDGTIYSTPESVYITVIPAGQNSGTFDAAFGTDGIVVDNNAAGGDGYDAAHAIIHDGNGHVYITGQSKPLTSASSAMTIWRYFDSNGTLDATFGTGGIVVYGLSNYSEIGRAIALDNDGNVYVAGQSYSTAGNQYNNMSIWKYDNSGAPVAEFGTNGFVTWQQVAASIHDWGYDIALDGNGHIYVTGAMNDYNATLSAQNPNDMMIWRFHDINGSLDTTFGTDGFVRHNNAAGGNGDDIGYSIALDSSGNIYVTGRSALSVGTYPFPTSYRMVIWKYDSNGNLDTTFGTGGTVVDSRYQGYGYSLILDNSNNIYVAGQTESIADMAIWKYDSSGNPDTAFGTNGFVADHNAAGGNGYDSGRSIVFDGSDNLYVTGFSRNVDNDYDMVIWNYDSTIGTLVTEFGTNGIVADHNASGGDGDDHGYGITLDDAGNVYVTGDSDNGTNDDMVIWKYK